MRSLSVVVMILLLCTAAMGAHDRDMIRLRVCTIDPEVGPPEIPADFRIPQEALGAQRVHLVKLEGPITAEKRRILTDAGLEILTYMPDDAFVVEGAAADVERVAANPVVVWTGVFEPYYKVHPELLAQDGQPGKIKLYVKIWRPDRGGEVPRVVQRLGGWVFSDSRNPRFRKFGIEVPRADLRPIAAALAHLQDTAWIEEYPDYELCNDQTAWVCQSGLYEGQATPLYDNGILGEGQIVAVMDTGSDADMCYFYDEAQGLPDATPNYDQRKIIAYIGDGASDWDAQGHGTHTSGTVAGDDFATPGIRDTGDGIAPAAKLVIQDYGDSWDVYPPDDEYAALFATWEIGATIHSNSWGWPGHAGEYHNDCEEIDLLMWDLQDFLAVYAAGNEGPGADSIRPPGTSKNVLTVGATEPGADAEDMASFSSHGPTDDGRRKPDIAICGGYSIYSADSDGNPGSFNCSTTGMAGTSMATPGAAGCAALVSQYYADGYYPLGYPEPGMGFTPSAALVKATIINSGDNMTGVYTADSGSGHGDIPTNGQGWGRIHLDNALYFADDERKLFVDDHREGLATGESVSYMVTNLGGMPFEVTLVWTDYPGSPSADVQLVNDLDLTVTYDGVEYKGNVYSGGESVSGGEYDRLNTVECVQFNEPVAGPIQVTVTAFNVPQSVQNYAIVITGNLSFSDGVVVFDSAKYNCSDTIQVTVSDSDLIGNGTQDVTIEGPSHPVQTYTLTETPGDSGVFVGTFYTTTEAPGPDEIQVAEGDEIVVTYIDADDGHGGINVEKTDTALIDCTAPVISNVIIEYIGIDEVTISWTTDEPASSVVYYGETTPPAEVAQNLSLETAHSMTLTGLVECTDYYLAIEGTDLAGNVAYDDNGGSYYTLTTLAQMVLLEESMDEDPGWTISGGAWAWGQPTGGGGTYGDPDPTAGYTGDNVYGYSLNGDYVNNMPAYHLTTPPFDCTAAQDTVLSFYRWLGVESSTWDHAMLSISTDGSNWTTLWQNPGTSLSDGGWVYQEYDISQYADGEPTVFLRWTMGTTDSSVVYCGWNIDDVLVSYAAPCNAPNLRHVSHTIDDSAGNGNGVIDYGETIVMPVTLGNFGIDATNVQATLGSSSSYAVITQADAAFGDIPAGGEAEGTPAYVFETASDAPDQTLIPFSLSWTSDESSGVAGFSETVHAPEIGYYSVAVLDQAEGDGDGILDPGERVQLQVWLHNAGSGQGDEIVAMLSSDHPEYVTIAVDTATYPTIMPGESESSLAPHFDVEVDPGIPDPTTVTWTLEIAGRAGYVTTSEFTLEITTSTFARRYLWDMSVDPGWTTEGDWEWGEPQGSCNDPSGGLVYGYNLAGCYPNNMDAMSLTTQPIDCSLFSDTQLVFQRWLGVERNVYDHAILYVSNDGTNWVQLWENPSSSSMQDDAWQEVTFDISSVADGQPEVYIRWQMGPTDSSVVYSGWNIDDVEIWAATAGETTPTPTASPTAPPSATPTAAPTATATPTTPPTTTPFIEPTSTPTMIATSTPTAEPTAPPPTATPSPTPTTPPSATPPPPPTATPVPPTRTPTTLPPTATPTSGTFVELLLNSDYFRQGDVFDLKLRVMSYDPPQTVHQFVLLDVFGEYYFHPGWTQDIDYTVLQLTPGFDTTVGILNFVWPSAPGAVQGLRFWAALLDTSNTNVVSNVAQVTFGYGP
jgi:hypothetical protein